jgi:hypothetical protein
MVIQIQREKQAMPEQKTYTVPELAKLIGVNPVNVYDARKVKGRPHVYPGSKAGRIREYMQEHGITWDMVRCATDSAPKNKTAVIDTERKLITALIQPTPPEPATEEIAPGSTSPQEGLGLTLADLTGKSKPVLPAPAPEPVPAPTPASPSPAEDPAPPSPTKTPEPDPTAMRELERKPELKPEREKAPAKSPGAFDPAVMQEMEPYSETAAPEPAPDPAPASPSPAEDPDSDPDAIQELERKILKLVPLERLIAEIRLRLPGLAIILR